MSAFQPNLFADDAPTIQAAFERFHAAHPDVFELFERYADQLLQAGRGHYGAKAIIERIRFDFATSSAEEEFKTNNSFTSRYVRLLIQKRPEFADFFEVRVLKTA